ncbi:MAG: alpha-amylase family glycosyl hydrolase [Candidatus Woesearchaeota archaeon]
MCALYQWEELIDKEPEKNIMDWHSEFGPSVLDREADGRARKVKVSLLLDNPETMVYLVGDFNDWGRNTGSRYLLEHDENSIFATIITDELKHGARYKFLVNGAYRQDPAGHFFDDEGNTIFWDFDDPTAYRQKHDFIDNHHRSVKVLQTDLPGLIAHWKDPKSGKCGRDISKRDYYNFISDSGILEHIRDLGFNTIQFLPFAQSIDGDNWKYRYLVPFQYAIQKNWGTPDDMARMIDRCHELGIAVIGDFVLGHLPFKDFSVFGQDSEQNGIHQWKARHGYALYMKEETSWGTMRIDFDNKFVRRFFISSCLHWLRHYRIDGLRIDNVDGIIRFGDAGQGDERPNGRRFLRELNREVYSYNPQAMINFEAHYFHEDNAKMLVVPFHEDRRALGATAYNSSRLTYYFHKDFMIKDVKKISPWKFRDITEEKEWGQSNSTLADFHNHDAAAGLMEGRATGSYAYDTMAGKNPANHIHALGKIKVMEAIISFCCEGRTLDLPQSFLLQQGTFEHDSSIHWYLTFNQVSRNALAYKRRVNEILDDQAFWPMNVRNRKFLNVDEKNKILVVERSAPGSRFVIVINLSAWQHMNYKVGITDDGDYKVVLNSDLFDYAGFGMISYPEILKSRKSSNFGLLDREVELSFIAPYGVIVLSAIE